MSDFKPLDWVTERTAYILRVRQLALQIAKAYVGEPVKATA